MAFRPGSFLTGWLIYYLAFYRVSKYRVAFFRVAFFERLIFGRLFVGEAYFRVVYFRVALCLDGIFTGGFFSGWLLSGDLFPRPTQGRTPHTSTGAPLGTPWGWWWDSLGMHPFSRGPRISSSHANGIIGEAVRPGLRGVLGLGHRPSHSWRCTGLHNNKC